MNRCTKKLIKFICCHNYKMLPNESLVVRPHTVPLFTTLTVVSRGAGGAVVLMCVACFRAECSCRTRYGCRCCTGAEGPSWAQSLVCSTWSPVAIEPSQAMTLSTKWEHNKCGTVLLKSILKNKTFMKQSYLPWIPVGRNSQVDTEIQFCCQLGLGPRHPSHRETQQHRLPKARSNLQSHKTGQPDTLDTHLQTHNDSSDLGPNCETSCLPGEINHHLSGTVPLSQSCLYKIKTIEDTILISNRLDLIKILGCYPWWWDPDWGCRCLWGRGEADCLNSY